VMTSTVDASVATVASFGGVSEIYEGSFRTRKRIELLANRITVRFRRNLIPDSRPNSSRTAIPWWSDFYHTTVVEEDAASHTAIAEWRPLEIEAETLRDLTTAQSVADYLLARNADGPMYVSFETGLCGLDVELGDNIAVEHFSWPVALVVRVERIVVDVNEMMVTLDGQALL